MSSNNECIEKILECLNNEENRLQEERNQLDRDNDAIRREILSFTKINIESKIKSIVGLREHNKKLQDQNNLYNFYKNLYIENTQYPLNNKCCKCCDKGGKDVELI